MLALPCRIHNHPLLVLIISNSSLPWASIQPALVASLPSSHHGREGSDEATFSTNQNPTSGFSPTTRTHTNPFPAEVRIPSTRPCPDPSTLFGGDPLCSRRCRRFRCLLGRWASSATERGRLSGSIGLQLCGLNSAPQGRAAAVERLLAASSRSEGRNWAISD